MTVYIFFSIILVAAYVKEDEQIIVAFVIWCISL